MSKVRERSWIPALNTILKNIKGGCESCKVIATRPFPVSTVRQQLQSRVTANYLFEVTGAEFLGLLQLKGGEEKAYVINLSSGTSRAVYATTIRSLETSHFIDKLNEFIAACTSGHLGCHS